MRFESRSKAIVALPASLGDEVYCQHTPRAPLTKNNTAIITANDDGNANSVGTIQKGLRANTRNASTSSTTLHSLPTTADSSPRYTDGSYDPVTHHAGSAYVFYARDEGCWIGKSRALGRVANPQAAEEAAIQSALEAGISGSSLVTDFAVRSDALWLVDAIKGDRYRFKPSNSRAIQEIVRSIRILEASNTRVSVEWVAAHSGIEGNEMADTAAKGARIRSPTCIYGDNPLTMSVRLFSPSLEERARYNRAGRIEFSVEHDRLLRNAASDRSLPRH